MIYNHNLIDDRSLREEKFSELKDRFLRNIQEMDQTKIAPQKGYALPERSLDDRADWKQPIS